MRHNLSVAGGNDVMKIYTGLGYYNQESIYRTNSNNMQRYNFRTNMEAYFKQIGLKVQTGVDAYIVDTKEPATASGRGYYNVWSHIQNKRPWEPAYNQYDRFTAVLPITLSLTSAVMAVTIRNKSVLYVVTST